MRVPKVFLKNYSSGRILNVKLYLLGLARMALTKSIFYRFYNTYSTSSYSSYRNSSYFSRSSCSSRSSDYVT